MKILLCREKTGSKGRVSGVRAVPGENTGGHDIREV